MRFGYKLLWAVMLLLLVAWLPVRGQESFDEISNRALKPAFPRCTRLSGTNELAALTCSELFFAYLPVSDIPEPDLVASIDYLTSNIKFLQLDRFVDFYDDFVASHSSLLRMQSDIDVFVAELRKVHAAYAKIAKDSDSAVYRVSFRAGRFEESEYDVKGRQFKIRTDGFINHLLRIVCGDDARINPSVVANRDKTFIEWAIAASLDEAEAWIDSSGECEVQATILYRKSPKHNVFVGCTAKFWMGSNPGAALFPIEVLGVRLETCEEPPLMKRSVVFLR